MSTGEIVKKYHVNGFVYDTYEEAEAEALKIDNKYAIKNILLGYLWDLCYDVDTRYISINECRLDTDYEYSVEVACKGIMRELQYDENKCVATPRS